MRLDNQNESDNIEDRRGNGGYSNSPRRISSGKIGVGTVVLALVAWYFGIDPRVVLEGANMVNSPSTQEQSTTQYNARTSSNDPDKIFVSKVLATTEKVWSQIFQAEGWGSYTRPRLVLYSGVTPTACGTGQAGMGPFYCPGDQRVYLDTGFFKQMDSQLGAPGDFARAYVIAHEIGHHVQNLLGILNQVNKVRDNNQVLVASELQADCFAGVWAYYLNTSGTIIEEGDIAEAINAASAVGDDTLQKKTQGYVVPDSFTHGSSAQRMASFKRGFSAGDPKQCNMLPVPN